MKPKLFCSFSGGQSSAYMAKRLHDEFSCAFDILNVFANTGEEREETLVFVDRCDKEWGLNVVWVEAVVHEGRVACTHRIVDFQTASRKGEPFEAMIQKYGIPNMAFPHCTRELKLNPMKSYLRSVGWHEHCLTAVGIRADEPKRIRADAGKYGIVYPLAYWFPTDKLTINDYWEDQIFHLGLLEHEGNCKWCWKKSMNKHFRLIAENPECFKFPARMETLYPLNGAGGQKRVFFRGNRSTTDLFVLYTESEAKSFIDLQPCRDEESPCSESCEAFGIGAELEVTT